MPNQGIRRFQAQFLKPVSVTDNRQVPAFGSFLEIHRQGASVRTAVTLFEGITTLVDVFDTGGVLVGDTVSFWSDGSESGTIATVDPAGRTVGVSYGNPGQVNLAVGDRLLSTSAVPPVYSDVNGSNVIANSLIALDSAGGCDFYRKVPSIDALLFGGGLTTRLYADLDVGWARRGPGFLNAQDYPNIQDAINALPPSGGTVYIPSGTYYSGSTTKFDGIVINNSNITIEGDRLTILQMATTELTKDMVLLNAGGVTLRNLFLEGPGAAGAGCGIRCEGRNQSNVPIDVAGFVFEDIVIHNSASWAIKLYTDSTKAQWNHVLNRVTCYDAFGGADGVTGGSVLIGPRDTGPVQISMRDCQFNGPNFGSFGAGLTKGAVHLENCVNVVIDNCTFQPIRMGTVLSFDRGLSNRIGNCHFECHDILQDVGEYWVTASGPTNNHVLFDNIEVYRRSTLNGVPPNTHPTSVLDLRFLRSDSSYAITNWVIRDCGFYHNQPVSVAPALDDVSLGTVDDSIVISNVLVRSLASPGGGDRALKVTSRPGVGYLASGTGYWQMKIPGVASSAVIQDPSEGSIVWDMSARKLRVFDNQGWQTLGPSLANSIIVDGRGDVVTYNGDVVIG